MAIVQRYNELLDLDEIDVLVDEVGTSRHLIITDLPDSLPQGKSSFLIELSPFMKDGVEIQMDFVDAEGGSIYLEPVSEYLEGTSRRVSAEIYGDTAPGIATLIVVGELEAVPEDTTIFSEADPVPEEYEGAYNVRLTKQVVINPTAVNTQTIKFFDQPRINVTEIRKGTMVRSESTTPIISAAFDVEGTPTDADKLFRPHGAIDSDIQQGSGGTASPKKQRNIKAYIESKKRKNKKGLRKNSAFKRSGLLSKTNSPATFPYQIRIGEYDGSESFRFNTSHIGATVTFFESDIGNTFANSNFYPTQTLDAIGLSEAPTFDTLKEQGITNASASMYTASIVDLINDKTAVVELPFTNKNNNGENIILPIFAKAKVTYENMPTGSYKADNLVSYADVKLSNMRTFSGDVYKVKVYVKSEGGFDDYKLLSETPLESKELLVDTESVGQAERTGYVILQSEVDKYWCVSGSVNGETKIATPANNAAYSNSTMLDAIELSSSLADSDDPNKHLKFQLKDKYKFNMVAGMDYSISFNAVGKKVKPNKDAILLVYVSGSSMTQKEDLYFDEANKVKIPESTLYGKRIGALRIQSSDDDEVKFGLVNQPFSNDKVGDGILQFRVLSGIWNISDMTIEPAADTGFSPSFFQFSQQIPAELSHKRPDTFEFLAEFYDVNNNIADTVAYLPGIVFDGANMSISGKDNVLESNMFIGGGNTASGMHLGGVTSTLPETGKDGATGSGFMRSVGYQGFISASAQSGSYGFMIYSGSVLPDSGDDYKGVGLELVGENGSLKFRTNPSLFEVKADSFFVGNKDLQFISGSGGSVEVSSSDFHLTPEGNVTASAILLGDKGGGNYLQFINDTLTVVGNLSVNNLFLPATIAGATSTVVNASSSLSSDGFAKFVSASIGGWEVNSTTIKSPGDNLQLQSNNKRFAVYDTAGTPKERIRIGEVDGGTKYGMKIFDGTGTADSDILVELGEGGNNLAGWTIGTDTIQGGNLILGKDGSIKSADYVSDSSGFIITAQENGYAEFENCKIRGTMATTTFEKESVNAVGGQMFIANSAALSGSAVALHEVSMSLKNVTGFAKGEVLLIKKVEDTGFNTEYVQVVSSSRMEAGGDTDPDGLAGFLLVQRGHGFFTRTLSRYYGNTGALFRWKSNSTDPVTILTKYHATAGYAAGSVNGDSMAANRVASSSLHINVIGEVTAVGDGTSLSLKVMNQSQSDLVLGTVPFWKAADGTGVFDKDLYIPTGAATGSNIKIGVTGVTDTTNDAYLVLKEFTASIDFGTIGTAVSGDSGSVGDPIGGPKEYTEGQVVVSTGRYISGTGNNTVGTGYIRLNANPNNQATPYMDIVERTGSGIYDVELKARLGDLSGVAGTRNVPAGFQGFGLMSEVAFLSGSNIKLEAPTFVLGDLNQNFVSGSNGNLEISSSNFHLSAGGDVIVSGEINASSGNFTGNLTSGATITGGTIRTADETSGAGKSVKLDGSNNNLRFFGDAAAFNAGATDIPTELMFLDDSNQLIEGNVYSKFPGLAFKGFDANSADYDNATDAGTSAAHNKGGFYIPYSYGKGYTQFETMYTGHAIGLYRGSLGQEKLSDNSDYGQVTPDIYSTSQLKLLQTNGSPSSPHNQDGNPDGFGGDSTYGAGGNNDLMMLEGTTILSRSNINQIGSPARNKANRSVSAQNKFVHGTANGGGYNYFKNYELTTLDMRNDMPDARDKGWDGVWYQWTGGSGDTTNLTLNSGGYHEFTTNYGSSVINNSQDGGSSHMRIGSSGAVVTPQTNAKINWTKCEGVGYRIKWNSLSDIEGNPYATTITVKLQLRWGDSSGTLIKDITIISAVIQNAGVGNITGELDLRDEANTWNNDDTDNIWVGLYIALDGADEAGTMVLDTGASDAAGTYVYAYGHGDDNTRVDVAQVRGARMVNAISGSDIDPVYGVDYQGFFGDNHYGLYARIRGADNAYGVRAKVNDSVDTTLFDTKQSGNGLSGGNVFAGYFEGNVHVTGNITYAGSITDTSDKRLKENIRIYSGSLNLIKQLQPKIFDWKENYEYSIGKHREGVKNEIGFIAQDVEKIIPNLVTDGTLEARDFDMDLLGTEMPEYKGKKHQDFTKKFKFLNYEKLIPHLVSAMQEQQEQIEGLQKQIEELQKK